MSNLKNIRFQLEKDIKSFLEYFRKLGPFDRLHTPGALLEELSKNIIVALESFVPYVFGKIPKERLEDYYWKTTLAKIIIDFAVEGISDPTVSAVWHDYYQQKKTTREIALGTSYSTRTIARVIKNLPEALVEQLLQKDIEIELRSIESPYTRKKSRSLHLYKAFGLTRSEAETLLLLIDNPTLSQADTAKKLNKSRSAIKKSLQSVRAKLKVPTTMDAILLANRILPDDEGPQQRLQKVDKACAGQKRPQSRST